MSGRKKRKRYHTWNWAEDATNRYSATLCIEDDDILWIWEGPKDQGGGATQSCYHFLRDGPLDKDTPPHILREIEALIHEAGIGRTPPPEPVSHAVAAPPPAPAAASTLLLGGSIVILAGVALPIGIALIAPTAGKYAGLFLPVLLGIVVSFRLGHALPVAAGLLALAAGIGSQSAFERYRELAPGATAVLTSPAEAPAHPAANRFIIPGARIMPALAGRYQVTTTRQHGSGPREQVRVHHVAPLVSAGWTPAQPVPAWIGCGISPGFDCLKALPSGLTGFVRVRQVEADAFAVAARDAASRHGLKPHPAAPVLLPTDDADGTPATYLARVMLFPLAALGLWIAIMLGWRVWQARQQPTA